MTNVQKSQIENYRSQGYGYKKIGQLTGLSVNTIKTYCKRNALGGVATTQDSRTVRDVCKCCGKSLVQNPGRKRKIFCSDACRIKWWNENSALLQHRDGRQTTCACCGQKFTVARNSTRKYCSHQCYIADRFHGGDAQ